MKPQMAIDCCTAQPKSEVGQNWEQDCIIECEGLGEDESYQSEEVEDQEWSFDREGDEGSNEDRQIDKVDHELEEEREKEVFHQRNVPEDEGSEESYADNEGISQYILFSEAPQHEYIYYYLSLMINHLSL